IQQLTLILRRSRNAFPGSLRSISDVTKDDQFDTRQLQILACPLSKKPLRYDEQQKELVCDELAVAYPIVKGIPYLNPQDGRVIGSPRQEGRVIDSPCQDGSGPGHSAA
ncbi:unnamed protein product, partial [Candidula unifasciata]